jgi:hypothetical protein
MAPGHRYSATTDQASLTAKFDFQEALRLCPSFDKCMREIEGILRFLCEGDPKGEATPT